MSIYSEIEALSGKFSGSLGLWAHSVDTGETVAVNADISFPSASTIKLPVLYEVYRQAGEGRFSLSDPLTVKADDVVPGSGVLKDLGEGVTLTVRQMATLMIIVSDNTATNILIDLVGKEQVNAAMDGLGLRNTHLSNKLFKGPAGAPFNCASPADLGRLMLLIGDRQVLTPDSCADMMAILGRHPGRAERCGLRDGARAAVCDQHDDKGLHGSPLLRGQRGLAAAGRHLGPDLPAFRGKGVAAASRGMISPLASGAS
jgi:beta-lactamase class A